MVAMECISVYIIESLMSSLRMMMHGGVVDFCSGLETTPGFLLDGPRAASERRENGFDGFMLEVQGRTVNGKHMVLMTN